MRFRIWLGILVLSYASSYASADDLVINSIESNGTITFSEVTNASFYSIEWAAESGGTWHDSWDSQRTIPATGNGSITSPIPMTFRVVADETPPGMSYIPAGSYIMGWPDALFPDNGDPSESPQHAVYIDAFLIERFEVTKALWDAVRNWAITNGYSIPSAGQGKASNHPVHTIEWFDAVKWCNARSQMEGLDPVYYTEAAQTNLYVTGLVEPYNPWVDWTANGYRLPTEAEWEKAARGGVADTQFPWSHTNTISHNEANYNGGGGVYDLSSGPHPEYYDGILPTTSPVGSFAPNDYQLYDMAGNVSELCWDRFEYDYYSESITNNPHGPSSNTDRSVRGGSWQDNGNEQRCSYRVGSFSLDYRIGFRCVRLP